MKVLIADDHSLFLEGLQNLLGAHGVEVVGTARDGFEAVEKARSLAPDVILMDIRMPLCDGLAATRLIKAERPDAKVVILTTSTEDEDLFEALRSGACGYLLKSLEAGPFLTYLEGVVQGQPAISRELAGALLREFVNRGEGPPDRAEDRGSRNAFPELTYRRAEILEHVAQGLTYKEVAEKLFLSEHTIKYHMGEILQRLNLKNREQAVAFALRRRFPRSGE